MPSALSVLPWFQVTDDVHWKASRTHPYPGAEPSVADSCFRTAKCAHNIPCLAQSQLGISASVNGPNDMVFLTRLPPSLSPLTVSLSCLSVPLLSFSLVSPRPPCPKSSSLCSEAHSLPVLLVISLCRQEAQHDGGSAVCH